MMTDYWIDVLYYLGWVVKCFAIVVFFMACEDAGLRG
jgi:hypothetical protein